MRLTKARRTEIAAAVRRARPDWGTDATDAALRAAATQAHDAEQLQAIALTVAADPDAALGDIAPAVGDDTVQRKAAASHAPDPDDPLPFLRGRDGTTNPHRQHAYIAGLLGGTSTAPDAEPTLLTQAEQDERTRAHAAFLELRAELDADRSRKLAAQLVAESREGAPVTIRQKGRPRAVRDQPHRHEWTPSDYFMTQAELDAERARLAEKGWQQWEIDARLTSTATSRADA
jgi:hypothetical protein